MPMYTYYCESCDRNFSTIAAYKNRKRRRKCSNCGKCGCPHTWDYSKSDDNGIQGIRGGDTPKFYSSEKYAENRDNQWLKSEIDNTKEAIKGESGTSPYSKMTPNYEVLEEQGVMKKVSESEAKRRKDFAGKVVRDAAKSMSQTELDQAMRPDKADSN